MELEPVASGDKEQKSFDNRAGVKQSPNLSVSWRPELRHWSVELELSQRPGHRTTDHVSGTDLEEMELNI